jgi:hypothetical protein
MTRRAMLRAMRDESDVLVDRARKADQGGDVRAITAAWRAYQAAETMRVLASELERIWRDLEGIDHGRAE